MCFKKKKKRDPEVEKEKRAFSKALLIQESILIWVVTLAFIVLAFFCIFKTFDASFMWLTALPTVAWGAYGVSQVEYYKKSKAENTKDGVVYETALLEMQQQQEEFEEIDRGA